VKDDGPVAIGAVAPGADGVARMVLAGATGGVLRALGEPWALLSDSERQRADKFRYDSDRHDFVAAHALARLCVATLLDRPIGSVDIEQRCEECGADHGQPYVVGVRDLHLSWSHGHGYVAAAAASAPIGVDVEVLDRKRFDDALLATVLTAEEIAMVRAADRPDVAFLRQWVRKECLIKLGVATLDTIKQANLVALPVDLDPDAPARWQPWHGDRHILDWWDAANQAVGAAIVLDKPAR
jgi:4'-phosphopantetheinyl transferase